MRKPIKRYELADNVTLEALKKARFRGGGILNAVPNPKFCYLKYILDEIQIIVEISRNEDNTFSFDDQKNVIVLDDDFCQFLYDAARHAGVL